MGDSKEGKISSWCDTNRISRYKVIKELSNEYPVTWICESLEITRRSYYKWLNRKDTDNDKMNKELVEFIKKLETNTISKALSRLGFGADVFLGKFDDSRYIQELNEKFGNEVRTKQLNISKNLETKITFSDKKPEMPK